MAHIWSWRSIRLRLKVGEGNGNPLLYSCLENPMDRGAWWAAVHGVAKSQTRLSDFTYTFHFHALEKEMATHSSVLAWNIPGTGEPGGLLSMGSHRVRHDWSTLAAAASSATASSVWTQTEEFRILLLIVEKNVDVPQMLCLASVSLSKADEEKSKNGLTNCLMIVLLYLIFWVEQI